MDAPSYTQVEPNPTVNANRADISTIGSGDLATLIPEPVSECKEILTEPKQLHGRRREGGVVMLYVCVCCCRGGVNRVELPAAVIAAAAPTVGLMQQCFLCLSKQNSPAQQLCRGLSEQPPAARLGEHAKMFEEQRPAYDKFGRDGCVLHARVDVLPHMCT